MMLVIRPEHPEDERAVVVTHIAAWRTGYAGILSTDLLAEAAQPTESYIEGWAQRRRRLLTSPNHSPATLVAELDGVIVGHVTYGRSETEPGTGQVFSCYVHPDNWGTGVADVLLDAALDALPQARVQLWVHPDNRRARHFYHRHGFRPDDARSPDAADTVEIRYALDRYCPATSPTCADMTGDRSVTGGGREESSDTAISAGSIDRRRGAPETEGARLHGHQPVASGLMAAVEGQTQARSVPDPD